MKNYPIVIDSGTGEQLTFLRRYIENDVELVQAYSMIQPGSGPPVHVHRLHDESLTVIEGLLAGQVQGEESEFDMLDIPWVVKKIIFPLTRFTGRLKGRLKRYADAPQPVIV
jgi:hypothetical protein